MNANSFELLFNFANSFEMFASSNPQAASSTT